MIKRKPAAMMFVVLALCCSTLAQNGKYQNIAIAVDSRGFLVPIKNAIVTVCTSVGCPTPASLCTSISDPSCTQSNIVSGDIAGNFSFYVQPGRYVVQISASGFATYTYTDVIVNAAGGIGGSGTVATGTIGQPAFYTGITTVSSAVGPFVFSDPTLPDLIFGPSGATLPRGQICYVTTTAQCSAISHSGDVVVANNRSAGGNLIIGNTNGASASGSIEFTVVNSTPAELLPWAILNTGTLVAGPNSGDNTFDIGQTGTNRPRNLYLGTSWNVQDGGTFGSQQTQTSAACETSFGITTLSTGATTTNTGLNCLPSTSVIDAVVYRITSTITVAANFTIGDGSTAARFCTTQSTLTAGTTGICFAQAGSAAEQQASAAAVRVTTNANPGAGAIRLIVYYHTWSAPTS